MDPRSEIQELKKKIEVLEAEIQELKADLVATDNPKERVTIRRQIVANTTRITVLDTRITENQKTINAATTTEGTIR